MTQRKPTIRLAETDATVTDEEGGTRVKMAGLSKSGARLDDFE
jgi:hypothetical protein